LNSSDSVLRNIRFNTEFESSELSEISHGYWSNMLRLKKVDLTYFLFFSFFIFFSILFFYFLFLEQLGLGLISHTVILSHLMAKSQDRSWDLGEFSRRFENKWHHTIWTPHVDLMDYTWLFRVGCTVFSMDYL